MAIPLAALALPALSAGLGAMEGYKKGGGTGALIGAGLGAATPAGLRMAGAGLAGIPALASLAQKGMMGARGLAGLSGPVASGANIIKGAVPAVGLALGAPQAVGGLGAQVLSGPTKMAGQSAAGVIGYTADGKPVYGGAALPPGMGQYGPTSPYGGPLDVLGPAGMGQRLQTLKDAQTQRDVLRTLLPEIEAAAESRSKKEFERQMAGAGIRQNIQTRAAMQQAAQTAGLQAGLGALQQAGGALTRQYQYQ
tara:strand:+ start:1716 stop:2471 length:756 start_codon:yes stop_codon:yes gene_type:complete